MGLPGGRDELPDAETHAAPSSEAWPERGSSIESGEASSHEEPVRAEEEQKREGQLDGEEQIRVLVDKGYEPILVAGVGGCGKSEFIQRYLLESERHQALQNENVLGGRRDERGARPTTEERFEWYRVEVGDRKQLIVDVAGELFRRTRPTGDEEHEVTQDQIEFLRQVAKDVRGIVLMLDLKGLWDQRSGHFGDVNREQAKTLAWIVKLIKYLREDDSEPPPVLGLHDHIDIQANSIKKKLDVPVLVLFSRSDEMTEEQPPTENEPSRFRGELPDELRTRKRRCIRPGADSPLLVGIHCAPRLHGTLLRHVRYFRYDFSQSLAVDPATSKHVPDSSCGVLLNMEWLWSRATRAGGFMTTSRWLALEKALDCLRPWRLSRWSRLPEPEKADPSPRPCLSPSSPTPAGEALEEVVR
ncbi:MAG: hypothetical protein AAF533_13075 [Acidobacteriota bacterium]